MERCTISVKVTEIRIKRRVRYVSYLLGEENGKGWLFLAQVNKNLEQHELLVTEQELAIVTRILESRQYTKNAKCVFSLTHRFHLGMYSKENVQYSIVSIIPKL